MKGKNILNLSGKIVKQLNPFCKRIQLAGSIRRKKKNPGDIDIVLIPKDKEKLEQFMKNKLKAKLVQGGEHESTWILHGIKIELYYTTKDEFGATLLAYTNEKGSNIGLRKIAKKKGFTLNSHGLFSLKTGKQIAGKKEREIYSALKRPYKEPWNR